LAKSKAGKGKEETIVLGYQNSLMPNEASQCAIEELKQVAKTSKVWTIHLTAGWLFFLSDGDSGVET